LEKKVLREISGSEGTKLHNEWLHGLYCSPNVIWFIKWRMIGWTGQVAGMGRRQTVLHTHRKEEVLKTQA